MNNHILPGVVISYFAFTFYPFAGRIQPLHQPATISKPADPPQVNSFPYSPLPGPVLSSNDVSYEGQDAP